MTDNSVSSKNTKKKTGFDNERYLRKQTQAILDRVQVFDDKLYLELGGKIIYDYHASRVLPGFDPHVKVRLLQKLKDKTEVIICVHARDIEKKKIREDFGITYDENALKMIDDFKEWGLKVSAVIITRFDNQPAAKVFKNKLKRHNIKVYLHKAIKGYPEDVDLIVSDEGYGANSYIETKRSLVIVTGPGSGSGKLATCLSQLYHDHKRGIKSGYAKFETFPVWNLPLKHPVNIAYEASTADIGDFNLIDPFHLKAYKQEAVNYNRDVEVFPILKKVLTKIMERKAVYKSPTDMGVNRIKSGIIDDKVIREASKQEIIRRYFRYYCEYVKGLGNRKTIERVKLMLEELDIKPEDRKVVIPARKAAEEAREKGKGNKGVFCGGAIELNNGIIVTGKNSSLMHAASSLILNAIKVLAEIPDKIHLLSPNVIKSIERLKGNILGAKGVSLDLGETLIALSISATTNPTAKLALVKLKELQGCEVHLTHMPMPGDEAGLRKLGVNLTSDPEFSSRDLFVE